MSQPTTTISFEHDDARLDQGSNEAEPCVDEIEFDLEYEPADRECGIIHEYFWCQPDPPLKCSECGHVYTSEERQQISAKMEKAAENYEGVNYDEY